MLPRKGKAPCTAAPSDDEDAFHNSTGTAPISAQATGHSGREAQSRAGVLRQLRPDAQDHQVSASKAAAAKRSAGAMSKEERQAKRARHMKEVRERQRVSCAAAHVQPVAASSARGVWLSILPAVGCTSTGWHSTTSLISAVGLAASQCKKTVTPESVVHFPVHILSKVC